MLHRQLDALNAAGCMLTNGVTTEARFEKLIDGRPTNQRFSHTATGSPLATFGGWPDQKTRNLASLVQNDWDDIKEAEAAAEAAAAAAAANGGNNDDNGDDGGGSGGGGGQTTVLVDGQEQTPPWQR